MENFIIYLIAIFVAIGGIDRILGNKFKIGEEFSKAFYSMGALSLSMIGIISISPVLADILIPIISPVYSFFGADPSMFASTLFALDMGGYKLATEMADDMDAANFSWVFLGTMMGPTLVFTIPVALNLIQKKDQANFAKGILIGLMTIPIGCLIGGWISGFHLLWMIKNLLPTILLSIMIMISLLKIPKATTKMFIGFSKIIEVVLISGLVIVIFQTLTGVEFINNLVPIHESFKTIGDITIMLAGAFPLVFFLQHVLKKPFEKAGNKIGLTHQSLIGLLSSLAHHVPMFSKFDLLDARGKVINTAFAVSGSFVMGSHLGFVAAVDKSFIVPMIFGKLSAGILAALIAYFVMNDKVKAN
ncbi:ethanolamine utilization protein EutH [Cytobacillus firmus]|uniref:ethanolamine utilization protein EutH n=1 Tax=Cytobacillus firmus TaxID=1399 RepID=UPI00222845C3|nr:ethanolamine utilization protein EutH [Cytobacillus firmus]